MAICDKIRYHSIHNNKFQMARIFMINFIFIDLPTVQSNVNQALNSLSVRILSDNETLNEARAKPHICTQLK